MNIPYCILTEFLKLLTHLPPAAVVALCFSLAPVPFRFSDRLEFSWRSKDPGETFDCQRSLQSARHAETLDLPLELCNRDCGYVPIGWKPPWNDK